MTEQTPSLVVTPTKCKLCGHIFRDSLLHSAAIVGSNPQAQLAQVQGIIKPLMDHLQKKHSNHVVQAQMIGGEFAGWITIDGAFEMDQDTKTKLSHDHFRWKVRQIVTLPETKVSDDRLKERVSELYSRDNPPGQNDVMSLMIELRDWIEERGKYIEPAPQHATPNGKPS